MVQWTYDSLLSYSSICANCGKEFRKDITFLPFLVGLTPITALVWYTCLITCLTIGSQASCIATIWQAPCKTARTVEKCLEKRVTEQLKLIKHFSKLGHIISDAKRIETRCSYSIQWISAFLIHFYVQLYNSEYQICECNLEKGPHGLKCENWDITNAGWNTGNLIYRSILIILVWQFPVWRFLVCWFPVYR